MDCHNLQDERAGILMICMIAGAVLFAAHPGIVQAQQEAGEVTVWAAPAEQKVRPEDPVEDNNLVWSDQESTVSVAGAANEHVPFQVVITTPVPEEGPGGADPEVPGGFYIESTDLTSDQGASIGQEHIEFFLEHYIHLYAKSSPIGATGYWPDALAPIKEPFSMQAEHSIVRNRPLWVDVAVPSGTPAGTYTGTVTVTQDGDPVRTLDVALEVYDFTLPEKTSLFSYIDIDASELADLYNKPVSSEEIQQLTRTYYKFLYSNRMERWYNQALEPEIELRDGEIELTFNEDEYQFYLHELNTKRVVLESVPSDLENQIEAEPFTESFNTIMKNYFSKVESYFEENGWENKLVFNSPIDEPNSKQEYEETRRWAELVDEATTDVPFMSTESPVTQNPDWGTFRGYVDNFAIHGNALNDPEVKQAILEEQAKGGEMTWYISCDQGYPQPNYFIDAPAMDPVMVPWITARYKMDGILYWEINHWGDTPNPWRDAVTFNSGPFCSGGYVLNGEGSLIYPGDYTEEYTGQPDVKGPVSSIRFELLREGIEDYVYLSMLKNHGAKEYAEKVVRSMAVDVSAFSRNAEELYRTRRAMAERIEELTD